MVTLLTCPERLVGSKYRWMLNYIPYSPYTHNHWVMAYRLIGIELVSPLIGCSELMTSKLFINITYVKMYYFVRETMVNNVTNVINVLEKMLQFAYHGNTQKN